jgi:hypothetical protein
MMRYILIMVLNVAIVLPGNVPGHPNKSCSRPPAESGLDPELHRVWEKFAQAVRTNDLPTLRQLSAACIRCTECLRNTAAEEKAFDKYMDQHPDTGYDRLFGPLSFIPALDFWRKDAYLIFDAKTKLRLLNPAKLRFATNDHNKAGYVAPCLIVPAQAAATHVYEVFLTYNDPSEQSEGMEKAFAFVKTRQGYKFCGYSTIP